MKKPLPKVGEIWVRKPDPRDTVQFRRRVRVTRLDREYPGIGVHWELIDPRKGQRRSGSCFVWTWLANYAPEEVGK